MARVVVRLDVVAETKSDALRVAIDQVKAALATAGLPPTSIGADTVPPGERSH